MLICDKENLLYFMHTYKSADLVNIEILQYNNHILYYGVNLYNV